MVGVGGDGTVLRQERPAYRRVRTRLDAVEVVIHEDAIRHAIDAIPSADDSVSRSTSIVAE
jgi:hypothetical protein